MESIPYLFKSKYTIILLKKTNFFTVNFTNFARSAMTVKSDSKNDGKI